MLLVIFDAAAARLMPFLLPRHAAIFITLHADCCRYLLPLLMPSFTPLFMLRYAIYAISLIIFPSILR